MKMAGMLDILGLLTAFAFGASEGLQMGKGLSGWWIIYPSLVAMVFTAAGDFRPRDILVLGAVPCLAAVALAAFLHSKGDFDLLISLEALNWRLLAVVMFLLATAGIIYAVLRLVLNSAARSLWQIVFGYVLVWVMYVTNPQFLYVKTMNVTRLSLDYIDSKIALGWIMGNQLALLAGFLALPALAGALRAQVPPEFKPRIAWMAVVLFGLWHGVALVNYAPMIAITLRSAFG